MLLCVHATTTRSLFQNDGPDALSGRRKSARNWGGEELGEGGEREGGDRQGPVACDGGGRGGRERRSLSFGATMERSGGTGGGRHACTREGRA